MEFKYWDDPIPLVQKKKKYSEFKLTPIGGPDEIKVWREMQAAKETTKHMRLIDRDHRITQYEREISEKLDSPTVKKEEWRDKVSRVLMERKELANRVKQAIEYTPWQAPVSKKKTLFQRFTRWLSNAWDNANS